MLKFLIWDIFEVRDMGNGEKGDTGNVHLRRMEGIIWVCLEATSDMCANKWVTSVLKNEGV